jgi:DNA topoisomerase IA
MVQMGTIANFEEGLIFNIGTLYLQNSNKKFDVVPCETKKTKQAFNAIFGTTNIQSLAGKNIQYDVKDGMLSWIGLDYGN